MAFEIVDQGTDRSCGARYLQQRRTQIILQWRILSEQFLGVFQCRLCFGQCALDLRREIRVDVVQQLICALERSGRVRLEAPAVLLL